MIALYLRLVREGQMTVDDVPPRWREEVRKVAEGAENELEAV